MSTKRKLLRERATVVIQADDLTAEGADGQPVTYRAGETIRLQKRVPMKLLRIAGRLQRLTGGDANLAELDNCIDALASLLAPLIVEWDWTDQGAAPDAEGQIPALAQPRDDPEVLWELEQGELFWILDKFTEMTLAPNSSSSP